MDLRKRTLDEWYRLEYTHYYMTFDTTGKFKEGKGLVSNNIINEVEKIIKKHFKEHKRNRKNDYYVEVIYSNKKKDITSITHISKASYNKITGWENLL